MKKLLVILMTLILAAGILSGCGGSSDTAVTKLSFKGASSYEELKKLDGKTVSISGYMATSSPADGSFIFLMNLPYQSCPFCKPNTSQLSNTMEVYPEKDRSFDYTTQAITVTGTLEVAESEEENFTDLYGYEFNFKIVDASYVIIKDSDMTEEIALWQKLADTDIINEIYNMYNYVNFLCYWPEYSVSSYTDADGNEVPGYFLYASDLEPLVFEEGGQYSYGYEEGYFDGIVASIEAVDATAFAELVANVRKAEALAEKALAEYENGNYTDEYRYVEEFGTYDYIFTLDNGEELGAEMDEIYMEFSDWLGNWEM